MKKKLFSLLLTFAMLVTMLTSCGDKNEDVSSNVSTYPGSDISIPPEGDATDGSSSNADYELEIDPDTGEIANPDEFVEAALDEMYDYTYDSEGYHIMILGDTLELQQDENGYPCFPLHNNNYTFNPIITLTGIPYPYNDGISYIDVFNMLTGNDTYWSISQTEYDLFTIEVTGTYGAPFAGEYAGTPIRFTFELEPTSHTDALGQASVVEFGDRIYAYTESGYDGLLMDLEMLYQANDKFYGIMEMCDPSELPKLHEKYYYFSNDAVQWIYEEFYEYIY